MTPQGLAMRGGFGLGILGQHLVGGFGRL
jgi:hypothetical protein